MKLIWGALALHKLYWLYWTWNCTMLDIWLNFPHKLVNDFSGKLVIVALINVVKGTWYTKLKWLMLINGWFFGCDWKCQPFLISQCRGDKCVPWWSAGQGFFNTSTFPAHNESHSALPDPKKYALINHPHPTWPTNYQLHALYKHNCQDWGQRQD